MKIEENNIDILDNARPSKRIWAWIIDFLTLGIGEFLIFIAVIFQIIKVLPGYVEADQGREKKMFELYDYSVSAHLIELKEDNTPRSETEMFIRFAYKEILLSYDESKEEFQKNGIETISNPYEMKPSSLENNELLYFFTQYANEKKLIDYQGTSALSYYVNTICKDSKITEYYLIDSSCSEIPVLKTVFAIDLYKELLENKQGDNFQNLYRFYDATYQKAANIVTSQPEYKSIYTEYEFYYYRSVSYIAFGILISHLLSFIIFYLIIPLFSFGYGMSLGKRLFKEVSIIDNKPIGKGNIALRSVFYFLETYCSILLSFGLVFGFNLVKSPLFVIGNIQISNAIFALISIVILIVNVLALFVRHDDRTISDNILNIDVKDANHFAEKSSSK